MAQIVNENYVVDKAACLEGKGEGPQLQQAPAGGQQDRSDHV